MNKKFVYQVGNNKKVSPQSLGWIFSKRWRTRSSTPYNSEIKKKWSHTSTLLYAFLVCTWI